ncbi:MAG: MvaI/BcnI family restriction endonuclease [bacterium]|nr:MvaI/BcnI family restriction endonuclease [bacterium]
MNIEQFRTQFYLLREQGFVKSRRKGPTGVGKTLEDHLGLTENNIALPDLPFAELKAHRANSSSMITLFTFNKKAWQMDPLEAVRKYGTLDPKGRCGLYFTMSGTPNSTGLFVRFEPKSVDLRHMEGALIASWNLADLAERFAEKFPAMILVTAEVEERGGAEYFHFVRAQLLTGVSEITLSQQFRAGNILLDLRLHDKGTHARNHGTGFRTYEKRLPQLFTRVEEI